MLHSLHRPTALVVLLALFGAGCQSAAAPTPVAVEHSAEVRHAPSLDPAATKSAPQEAVVAAAPQSEPTAQSQRAAAAPAQRRAQPESARSFLPDLSVFRSAAFRTAFTESFAPASAVEPPIGEEDRADLQRVVTLLRPPEASAALPNETAAERREREAKEEAAAVVRREQALIMVEKIRRDPACHANHHLIAGNLYFSKAATAATEKERRGLYRKSVAAYQAAVESFPRFLRAWQGLGQAQYRAGNYAGVVDALTEVVKLGGASGTTFGLLGVAYANTRRYLEAETAFRRAAMLQPKVQDWKLGLAESLFAQKRYSAAAVLCGSLIARQPDKESLWEIQAKAYVGMRDNKQAAENFEVIDALGKSTVDSLNTLGDIYVNEGLYNLASSAYVRALAKDELRDQARGIRAAKILVARAGYVATGQVVDYLEQNFGDRLTKQDRIELLRLRSRIALAEGGSERQAAILEEILKVEPLDGDALVLLGRYYGRNKKEAQAIFFFERAAGIEAFEARARLGHAELLVRQRKYRAAVPLLKRAYELRESEAIAEFLEKVQRAAKTQK